MTTPRRVGAETSKTRSTLLDKAERIMLDEGYVAVTYRGVAARAGVTSGLVQYYFPTLDDLFLGLVRRRTEQTLGELVGALQADQPLRALWEFSNNQTAGALIAELTALANHRKKIRAEIAAVGEKVRELVLEAMTRSSNDYTVPLEYSARGARLPDLREPQNGHCGAVGGHVDIPCRHARVHRALSRQDRAAVRYGGRALSACFES